MDHLHVDILGRLWRDMELVPGSPTFQPYRSRDFKNIEYLLTTEDQIYDVNRAMILDHGDMRFKRIYSNLVIGKDHRLFRIMGDRLDCVAGVAGDTYELHRNTLKQVSHPAEMFIPNRSKKNARFTGCS